MTHDAGAIERLRRRATYASVSVALALIIAKLGAYLITESVSILSSLIDSSTDLLASLVTLLAVRHALKPPDLMHRYGHGKAEALAALAQAAFISGSALFLSIEAVRRLIYPEPISQGGVGIAVMVLSIVLTFGLITFQRHVVARTGSIAIGADRLHYAGDLLMNSAVIAALLLTMLTGVAAIDPLAGLAIAAFLLHGARGVARQALAVLMDRELEGAERDRIAAMVLAHDGALGLHDLRTRSTGTGIFIEFHLEVDPLISVVQAHDIADAIERTLVGAFPSCEVLIHQEPAGLQDERLDNRIGALR
ncbi:cation diffusion facilitator family transporter [Azospirillum halopraeferens]|uniref:cation diffusion facilitator family transporter n=1 Tax=Azospirillum halopraeferens TaxID=34010 RepID=UPI00068700FD|nr:cation diffusion facilitator family transporter [Azospirillum halopraeferens]